VFAAYNRIAAPKDICVFEYNEHEGGGVHQAVAGLRLARAVL
jgi:cephalosporin-C deacetylase-like acetyl esterase